DVDDARNGARLGVINARHSAAEARRVGDHHRQHARLADMDGELSRAVALGRRVELLDGALAADEPKLGRVLERRVGWHRQLGGRLGKLTKATLPIGFGVPQYATIDA